MISQNSELVDLFGNPLVEGNTAKLSDYSPWEISSWFRTPRDLPIFNFATIRAMNFDESVRLGMAMREGVIANATFGYQDQTGKWIPGVKAESPDVAEYVWSLLKRVWTFEIDKWLKCLTWGWSGGETVWKMSSDNRLLFDYAISPHARDIRTVRHSDHGIVGVEIASVSDMGSGKPLRLDIRQKGWFVANREDNGSDYGTSDYLGAYSAFADKWFNGGALDVRRLFMHTDAYRGMRIGFATGSTELDGIGLVPNQNIARQMVEQYKSGNVMTYPLVYTPDGKPKWQIDDASSTGNVNHILQYPQDLDQSIFRGLEIPDDVLTSEMSGAWQGKKVPMIAFFVSLMRQANKILRSVDESIIEFAVETNFGKGVKYEVGIIPFDVQLELTAQANQPQQGGMMGQDPMGGMGMPQGEVPMMGQDEFDTIDFGGTSMSLERAVGRGAISASQIALAGRKLLNEQLLKRGWVPFLDESEPVERTARLSLRSDVSDAAAKTDRNPSDEEAESGNYRKGSVRVHGMRFVIENAKGSVRSGKGWEVKMPCHYGYLVGFPGADGDEIDCFMGDDPESELVVVIDQVREDGELFDEHKVMLGFIKSDDAVQAYRDSYSKGWKVGPVTSLTMDQFKKWLEAGYQDHRVSDFNLGALQRMSIQMDANTEWQPFKGARGGQGWKNSRTGNVVYQKERPGTRGDGKEEQGGGEKKGSKPSAPRADRSYLAEAKIVGNGKEKTLTMADGSPVPDHIAAIVPKIPPAWTNIQVSTDPSSSVVATGYDAKGRKQTVYSADHAMKQAAAKFARVSNLRKDKAKMASQITKDSTSKDPAVRETASVLRLIMATGIRPGSERDTGAEKQAYGATTLRKEHVIAQSPQKGGSGPKVILQFTGKKGVDLSIPVHDEAVANDLIKRAQSIGPGEQLFKASDGDLRQYMSQVSGGKFKPKDLRTLRGTEEAARLVSGLKPAKSEKEYKAMVKDVATKVSKVLGNTPTIALQSYIDPFVFSSIAVAG